MIETVLLSYIYILFYALLAMTIIAFTLTIAFFVILRKDEKPKKTPLCLVRRVVYLSQNGKPRCGFASSVIILLLNLI